MKPIFCLLALFGWSVALPAQTPSSGLTLAGVVNLTDYRCALLSFVDPRPYWRPADLILREGERHNSVELLRVLPGRGAVEVRVHSSGQPTDTGSSATNLLLNLPAQTNGLTTETPTVWLNGVAQRLALDLYAQIVNRTLLRHPHLRPAAINLRSAAATTADAATALSQSLASNNVALILEGDKFVLAVPSSYADRVRARAAEIGTATRSAGTTNIVFQPRSVNFTGADLRTVTSFYAQLRGREVLSEDWFDVAAKAPIFFLNQTPLTRAEMLYVYETFLEWHGVKFEPEGEKFIKPVRFRPN